MLDCTLASREAYSQAREHYAGLGVDCEAAMRKLSAVSLSLHCWQGDDIRGFEGAGEEIGGGLAVTGNYPGPARTPGELRADFEKALSLIPGSHRLNLHAIYAETGGKAIERDALLPEHFEAWREWARDAGLGIDFNPTFLFLRARPRRRTASRWPTRIGECGSSGLSTGRHAAASERRLARRSGLHA